MLEFIVGIAIGLLIGRYIFKPKITMIQNSPSGKQIQIFKEEIKHEKT